MRITPDGVRYLHMAQGCDQPSPFFLRRGLPQMCRTSETRWVAANVISMVYATVGIGVLAFQHGATLGQSCLASLLFLGLPWVRFCASTPVLVDMPALMLAVYAAILLPYSPLAAGFVVFAAAYVSERAPIWAAIFAWNPVLLLGLLVPLVNWLVAPRSEVSDNDPLADTLRHPLQTGLVWHRDKWLDPKAMVLPWGACLVAVFNPSWWLLAALAAGYVQLLFATDTVRLYQQAAPVVCISAVMVFSTEIFLWIAAPLMVVCNWLNPHGSRNI